MENTTLTEGERWDGIDNECTLKKFNLLNEIDGTHIGVIYLDLYPREGKYRNAAHFTIRCGHEGNGSFQSPIVAVVCNLSSSQKDIDSTLMSITDVETLFHEFGHALHSLLSHTSFQHLSGTRTAMDFIETPSNLMEYYVYNPDFLKFIGKHYITGKPISSDSVYCMTKSFYTFRATEIRSQVLLAHFDQILFGLPSLWSGSSTTDLLGAMHREYSVPYADGTHWHSQFGHLVTYGSGYYSYLYAGVFAANIWKKCFNVGEKALCRNAGVNYWRKMLIYGGAKDPNQILLSMLKEKPNLCVFFNKL